MSFKNITTNAAQAERDGHYKEAGRLWIEASFLAKKTDNQQWAKRRAEFCVKAAGGRYVPVVCEAV
ncbi:ANR family transcriptional regulator [Morganella morganii]|uniref:ANR family transcriptional regulator n=1 Tax=Morganella morganii TaxID=582 RepID=UPI00046879D6|nr:ANR family transcriptional regulator [Morganella morganii]